MNALATPHLRPDGSSQNEVEFIDFGCGSGKSLSFVRGLTGGDGFGIDISEQAVAECWEAGLPAEVGDLLSYTGRNAAAAVSAIDLLPEIGERADFDQAVSRMILAARNYVLIQHNFFDADSALALQGKYAPSHFGKRLRFKPTMADYLALLSRLAASHSVCGVAMFGVGEAKLAPLGMEPAPADSAELPPSAGAYRNLRVVIGRKEVTRFRAALRRARAGQTLFLWERPAQAA
ncbi:MAG: methionine biosynthesis protein MetW [Roseococcus sp.]|nr:methionine biosynthesis protein MetW [Roseococcus sp.]